ncbi:MAG: DNA polymerase III subunit gamma/tau [Coriobacteriia bacterium]|nr:DNA polymerase III subunit gamma/tau [Coriobacteriia bacterium]
MSRQSLYRLYRPATFAAVVGQNHIERTLRNAVATDSVAHAYLFSGPRGTGKTTTARILAAALVCGHTTDGEPDGSCEQCLQISEGRHPDIIELDAASQTGVDNVREEIINNMHLATVHGKAKVYIIDEVHMLSKGAFNALLKTLEEPPQHVIFILCTTDPQKVLSTVRSRCQEFDFHPIGIEDITGRLGYIAKNENIAAEPAALELIARHAQGGMRDAITLFERMSAYSGGNITVADVEESMGGVSGDSLADIMRIVARRDTPACFSWVADQVAAGTDLVEATRALLDYARDAYVIAALAIDGDTAQAKGVDRSGDDLKNLQEIAGLFAGVQQLARLLDLLFDLSDKLRHSTEPRILVELTLARATNAQGDQSLEALAQRIEVLEQTASQTLGRKSRSSTATSPAVPAATPPAVATAAVAAVEEVAAVEPTPAIETRPAEAVTAAADTALELSDDLATLNRNWSEILEQIRVLGPSRHPLFANARLAADLKDQVLVIEFAQADSFKFKQAAKSDNRELLEKAIAAVYDATIPFVLKMGQFDATGTPAAAVAPEPEPEPEPVPLEAYFPSEYDLSPGAEEAFDQQQSSSEPQESSQPAQPQPSNAGAVAESAAIPAPDLELNEPPQKEYTPPTREVATLLDDLGATVIRQTTE